MLVRVTEQGSSVQFSSVAQSCPTLCDPMNRSTPGLPVHHQNTDSGSQTKGDKSLVGEQLAKTAFSLWLYKFLTSLTGHLTTVKQLLQGSLPTTSKHLSPLIATGMKRNKQPAWKETNFKEKVTENTSVWRKTTSVTREEQRQGHGEMPLFNFQLKGTPQKLLAGAYILN